MARGRRPIARAMNLRTAAVRWVPRHTAVGRVAWRLGRRYFAPKVLVPGTLGDIFLLVSSARLSEQTLRAAGFPSQTRIDHSWPVKPGDVHRSHGYHLCVIQIDDDPGRSLNAYRAAFVESSMILLDATDLTPVLWRLRGLGDPLGYRAAHLARDAQDLLDPTLSDVERFGLASVAQLAARAKCLVVRDARATEALRMLGCRTPIEVIPPGPEEAAGLSRAIERTLAMVKDPAHAALELWARALADMGVQGSGPLAWLGTPYLEAMESFKGTPSNLQERA